MRIYTGGTFDLLHVGHLDMLRYFHSLGEVVVALNTDEFIEEYKGAPSVMSLAERFELLTACKYVDEVVINWSGADSKPTILDASVDVIGIGSDWYEKDYLKQMGFSWEWLHQNDLSILYYPRVINTSTTDIKGRISYRESGTDSLNKGSLQEPYKIISTYNKGSLQEPYNSNTHVIPEGITTKVSFMEPYQGSYDKPASPAIEDLTTLTPNDNEVCGFTNEYESADSSTKEETSRTTRSTTELWFSNGSTNSYNS